MAGTPKILRKTLLWGQALLSERQRRPSGGSRSDESPTELEAEMNSMNERKNTMKTMQRFGLTALGLVLAAQFASAPALARKPSPVPTSTYTFTLIPPPTDAPEPQARGSGTVVTDLVFSTGVSVKCKRLTPGQQYHLMIKVGVVDRTGWPINPFVTGTASTTDNHGNLEAQIWLDSDIYYYSVNDVWIENDAGQLVLEVQWDSKK
jgi:hypothetical protein